MEGRLPIPLMTGEEEQDNPKETEKISRKTRSARYRCAAWWNARRSHSCKYSMHRRASGACASRLSSRPPLPDGAQQEPQVQLMPSNIFTLELGSLRSVDVHFVGQLEEEHPSGTRVSLRRGQRNLFGSWVSLSAGGAHIRCCRSVIWLCLI